jgi:hypothetical protein
MRGPPSAIAEKGLQATAANTPWRRNIRLENAKLHLRSFKSIGGNLIFWVLTLQRTLLGKSPVRAGLPGASNRKQLNPNPECQRISSGKLSFWEKL